MDGIAYPHSTKAVTNNVIAVKIIKSEKALSIAMRNEINQPYFYDYLTVNGADHLLCTARTIWKIQWYMNLFKMSCNIKDEHQILNILINS